MEIDLLYGHSFVAMDVPDHAKIINCLPAADSVDICEKIRQTLDHPIGSLPAVR